MYPGAKEDEYWKPVIVHNIEVEGYLISNYGNVIGKKGRLLKWNTNNTGNYPKVGISLPLADFTTANKKITGNTVTRMIQVHILVANSHLPFSEHLPEVWRGFTEINGVSYRLWDLMSDNQKAVLRSVYQVDHIDGNKMNAHISNLRYVSPRENADNYHYESSNKQSNIS